MYYRKSKLLNEIEHLHCNYSITEINVAIDELEKSIKNSFGVGFRHKGTSKAEQDLKYLYLIKERAIEHKKYMMFNQLKKYLEPNVVINLMNNVKNIDDRLILTFGMLLFYGGKYSDLDFLNKMEELKA